MKRHDITQFLTFLGAKLKGGTSTWVTAQCPRAPWKHTNGTDNNPSFGGGEQSHGESLFHCFTCGFVGNAYDLVMDIRMMNRLEHKVDVDIKSALEIALEEEEDDETEGILDYDETMQSKVGELVEFPMVWLNSFNSAKGHPYLKGREVPDCVVDDLNIKFDFQRQTVCFPVMDFHGRCYGLHGRDVTGEAQLRYYAYDYQGHRNPQIWMNEDKLDLDEPVVVVEGPFDLLRIYEVYPNVAAGLMGSMPDAKYKRLRDAAEIVTYFDIGTGGDRGRERAEKHFKKLGVKCSHIEPEEEYGDAGETPLQVIAENLERMGIEL